MKYDYNQIGLLLHVVDSTNPNKYPKLKSIHDRAMQDLVDIADPPSQKELDRREAEAKAIEDKKIAAEKAVANTELLAKKQAEEEKARLEEGPTEAEIEAERQAQKQAEAGSLIHPVGSQSTEPQVRRL